MAKRVRVKYNRRGFEALRKLQVEDLMRRGRRVAQSAGTGVEVRDYSGKTRARVGVFAAHPRARRRVSKDPSSLVRALNAGR